NLYLFYKVGTDVRGILTLEFGTDAIPRIVHGHAVPAYVYGADPLAGEASLRSGAGRRRDQLKDVAGGHRRVQNLDIGQHDADRGGRRGQSRVGVRDPLQRPTTPR